MPCGGRKNLPALIHSAGYILLSVLYDQRMYSENSKIVVFFIHYLNKFIIWVIFRLTSVFETTALLNLPIYSIFLWHLLPCLIGSLMRVGFYS